MGSGCHYRQWMRENDQSVAYILALAILLATCKSEKVPDRYMLMLIGNAKMKKKVTSTLI